MTTNSVPANRHPSGAKTSWTWIRQLFGGQRLSAPAAIFMAAALALAGLLCYDSWLTAKYVDHAESELTVFARDLGDLREQVNRLTLGDMRVMARIGLSLKTLGTQGTHWAEMLSDGNTEVEPLVPKLKQLTASVKRASDLFEASSGDLENFALAARTLTGMRGEFMAYTETVADERLRYLLKVQYGDLMLMRSDIDPYAIDRARGHQVEIDTALASGTLLEVPILLKANRAASEMIDHWSTFRMSLQRLRSVSSPIQAAYLSQQLRQWQTSIQARHSALILSSIILTLVLAGVTAYYLLKLSKLTRILEESKGLLERRVKERTAELTDANQSLRREIAERHDAESRLKRMAMTDPLTGLGNRRFIRRELDQRLLAGQLADRKTGLFLIDLDHFKYINDTYGHETGDELLREVGRRLGNLFGANNTIVRLGDDEFAALVCDVASQEKVAETAGKILSCISERLSGQDLSQLVLKASIGISMAPDDSMEAETLLRMAGVALEAAKQAGRANFQFYQERMDTQSRDRRDLENDLSHAISEGQFTLFYQPQVDISTGKICGTEALIRWHHPKRGMVSPIEFIPIAEENGSIVDIGRWALWTAAEQRLDWAMQGLSGFRVAVNVSPLQIQSPGFVETVATMLEATGLDPRLLELEVTENLVISQSDDVPDVLHDLYCLGVELAIDDFGTGYSSLNYLKRFSVNRLKIDRSFISGAMSEAEDRAIVNTVIKLGHSLGLRVLAEGVEDQITLDFLKAEGCDEVQGYFYAKPMPADEFVEWAKRFNASTVEDEPPKAGTTPPRALVSKSAVSKSAVSKSAVSKSAVSTSAVSKSA